ncbi:tetratricopeptide repeat protein [Alteribacillus bidgolensis]|uniref:Anaphase-promoting complex subunit 6 n=1 Tax=Alteribacillus bidgolensis TaxID=930129 RepID=A0A1G8JIW7_9BACI|nr:tetratricopeptide repeat protein [Alteribacillus bidgolensis]SDI30957.1 anaphase-promoting complex subunit 6 [Alteribacillus bidgolensis]
MYHIDLLQRKLDQLIKESNNPVLYNEIGVLLYQLNDWNNAEMYLQKACQLDSSDEDVLYNYAEILYKQSQWEKSISMYNAYLEIQPHDIEVMQKAGNSYYLIGDYEKAQKMYEPLKRD